MTYAYVYLYIYIFFKVTVILITFPLLSNLLALILIHLDYNTHSIQITLFTVTL